MFNFFKKKYEYARLINADNKGFVLITEDNEEEIGKIKFVQAMNIVGNKGWELVQSDEQIGFLFKKVK